MAGWLVVGSVVKALAWPAIALTFMLKYQGELRALLNRLVEFGPQGAKFSREAAEAQQISEIERPSVDAGTTLPAATTMTLRPALAGIEARLRSELADIPADKRQEVLLRALTFARASASFDQIHRIIFGTQIKLVQQLNGMNAMPLPIAREYYERNALAGWPKFYGDFPFERYIEFLVAVGLIEQSEESISITNYGA